MNKKSLELLLRIREKRKHVSCYIPDWGDRGWDIAKRLEKSGFLKIKREYQYDHHMDSHIYLGQSVRLTAHAETYLSISEVIDS